MAQRTYSFAGKKEISKTLKAKKNKIFSNYVPIGKSKIKPTSSTSIIVKTK